MVLGQVGVRVAAVARIEHALLQQRHDNPHVVPPSNCERVVLAFSTRPTAKTPDHPQDAHLTGVAVDANLDELRAVSVHRVARARGDRQRRQIDGYDQLAAFEHGAIAEQIWPGVQQPH